MKARIFNVFVLFIAQISVFAQDVNSLSSIAESLNGAFEPLDCSHISSGYLSDHTGLSLYDSNYVVQPNEILNNH